MLLEREEVREDLGRVPFVCQAACRPSYSVKAASGR
jgi:hypothetical protein